jgi:hypothetical protein
MACRDIEYPVTSCLLVVGGMKAVNVKAKLQAIVFYAKYFTVDIIERPSHKTTSEDKEFRTSRFEVVVASLIKVEIQSWFWVDLIHVIPFRCRQKNIPLIAAPAEWL